jgi:hypothetical protein
VGLQELDPLEQLVAGDQRGLDHLGHPGAELSLGERGQRGRVHEHLHRVVEAAHGVLAAAEIDGGLAAQRRVDLPDQRRRGGQPVDAAPVQRGGQAAQVGDHAAAHGDQQAVPVEAGRVELHQQRAQRIPALGSLARLEQSVRVHQQLVGQQRRDVAIAEHEYAARCARLLVQRAEQPLTHLVADAVHDGAPPGGGGGCGVSGGRPSGGVSSDGESADGAGSSPFGDPS